MDFSDFLALLQFEVQKSYDFVHEITRPPDGNSSVLHAALETVELEIPVSLSTRETNSEPSTTDEEPGSPVVRLRAPYTASRYAVRFSDVFQQATEGKDPAAERRSPKKERGSILLAQVVSLDSGAGRVASESVGRLKVTIKPILD